MGSVRRSAGATVLCVVLAGGLAGCVGPFADGEKEDQGLASGKGGAVTVATADPGRMLARATFDAPQAKGAKVEIGVVSLTVNGKLATLTLSVTPNVPGVPETSVYKLVGGNSPDVSLVDTVYLERHVVVKDSKGHALEPDYVVQKIANGQSTLQNYTFAAPPENAKTVNVHFGPFPPFRDVPVER